MLARRCVACKREINYSSASIEGSAAAVDMVRRRFRAHASAVNISDKSTRRQAYMQIGPPVTAGCR
ncbi:unnamed protein product [Protopolystoma xenopodis]|uniref:Uncharacterized protein n=1 Tax=Protopolystoma xenopodis TaxID=117903 RepID=A0A3S5CQR1_9PLAT|nr:unnamed protein product [Protopolystoma xenopodis]